MSHANEYFADKTRESWSSHLKYMATSARAYRWAKDHPKASTPPIWAVYRAVHMGLLEPDRFKTDVVVYKKKRDKRVEEYRDFLAAHEGAEILKQSEFDTVRYMIDAGMNHKRAWELLSCPGPSEYPVHWTDPITGIECKGLLDHHPLKRRVVDVKCSTPGDFHWFEHSAAGEMSWGPIRKYKFHGQVGGYEIMSEEGEQRDTGPGGEDESNIVALESAPPFDVAVHEMGAWSEMGQDLFRECVRRVAECRDSGQWDGLHPEPIKNSPPSFMYNEAPEDLDYSGLDAE